MFSLKVEAFLAQTSVHRLFDKRSLAEYNKGHIPTALYYSVSGFRQYLADNPSEKDFLFYTNNSQIEHPSKIQDLGNWTKLDGGYEAFKSWRDKVLEKRLSLLVIYGKTGSGKTELLHLLKKHGEQVIDLEYLARHRGSVFGEIPNTKQPTEEQFLNELSPLWSEFSSERPTFIESEAAYIGRLRIPPFLSFAMKEAKGVQLILPQPLRVKNIMADYATLPEKVIFNALLKLTQRLGKEKIEQLLAYLAQNKRKVIVEELLDYYDQGEAYIMKEGLPTIKMDRLPFSFEEVKKSLYQAYNT